MGWIRKTLFKIFYDLFYKEILILYHKILRFNDVIVINEKETKVIGIVQYYQYLDEKELVQFKVSQVKSHISDISPLIPINTIRKATDSEKEYFLNNLAEAFYKNPNKINY